MPGCEDAPRAEAAHMVAAARIALTCRKPAVSTRRNALMLAPQRTNAATQCHMVSMVAVIEEQLFPLAFCPSVATGGRAEIGALARSLNDA